MLPGFLRLLAKLAIWNYLPTRKHASFYNDPHTQALDMQRAQRLAHGPPKSCAAAAGHFWWLSGA